MCFDESGSNKQLGQGVEMKQAVWSSIAEKDRVLLLEAEKDQLAALDEDGLAELHTRVQRARTKHVKNYRRSAADRVATTGSRGGAKPGNQRMRDRAEAFEDALARVSRALARAARQSAAELRAERLAAAANPSSGQATPVHSTYAAGTPPKRLDDRRITTPARKKREAGTAATGARRQARRDNR